MVFSFTSSKIILTSQYGRKINKDKLLEVQIASSSVLDSTRVLTVTKSQYIQHTCVCTSGYMKTDVWHRPCGSRSESIPKATSGATGKAGNVLYPVWPLTSSPLVSLTLSSATENIINTKCVTEWK